jgi:hypothetical protein
MKTSETINKIAPALVAAQKAITFATKDAKNPHFKSTYADLPAVIDAIKPALNEQGIMFLQAPSPSEPGTLALTTRLVHSSGEWIEDTATVPLPKNDPQGYGSAMTYARRYALAAITGLYQDDDDGNAASHAPAKPAQQATVKAQPKPALMPEHEVDACCTAMLECDDMEALKGVYAGAWKRADATARKVLQAAYEARKTDLEVTN